MRRLDIPTRKNADIPTIEFSHESIVVFGAPERRRAFGARTFLVFSHQK
jgi:hypothetical protein